MGQLQQIITPLHTSTKRDYLARMNNNKVHCMRIARNYGQEYWDGDRKYGYGGYKYDGRWSAAAQKLINLYKLPANAKILDVGCGKAFLLYELKKLLPQATIVGFDASAYAVENAKAEIRSNILHHQAEKVYPFKYLEFDLVISITTLHNLKIHHLSSALQEIERVGKNKYVVVESYRNEEELFNLECWALTCQAFFSPEEWRWLFDRFGYRGDYEFIYFQ